MSVTRSERCNCRCHTRRDMKHCMPCCTICPICGMLRIKYRMWRTHVSRCEQEAIQNVMPRFKAAWCQDTASPGDAARWTRDNPTVGQCAVTALLVQDLLGGQLLRTVIAGFGSHYYNLLQSGETIDLTRDQFPEGLDIPPGEERDREYVLDSPGAVNARTRERYELLRERYVTCRPRHD